MFRQYVNQGDIAPCIIVDDIIRSGTNRSHPEPQPPGPGPGPLGWGCGAFVRTGSAQRRPRRIPVQVRVTFVAHVDDVVDEGKDGGGGAGAVGVLKTGNCERSEKGKWEFCSSVLWLFFICFKKKGRPATYKSKPHRHDDVFVLVVTGVDGAELRLGVSVFEFKRYLAFAVDVHEILQVLSVESDIDFFAGVIGLNGFAGFAFFGILSADHQLIGLKVKPDCMRPFVGHQSNAAHGLVQKRTVKLNRLVDVLGYHHFVIRKLSGKHSRYQQPWPNLAIDVILIHTQTEIAVEAGGKFRQLCQRLARYQERPSFLSFHS